MWTPRAVNERCEPQRTSQEDACACMCGCSFDADDASETRGKGGEEREGAPVADSRV